MGIALAMVGIIAIVGWGYDRRPRQWQGIVLGLASGITFACIAVSLRGLRDLDPIWLSAFLNLMGSVALGLWAWASGQRSGSPTRLQILVLIGFGVFHMAIPYALFARGLREIGAPEAGLIGLVEPILNPIWAVMFDTRVGMSCRIRADAIGVPVLARRLSFIGVAGLCMTSRTVGCPTTE